MISDQKSIGRTLAELNEANDYDHSDGCDLDQTEDVRESCRQSCTENVDSRKDNCNRVNQRSVQGQLERK